MSIFIFTLVVGTIGFAAGYVLRETISRKRRALSRKAWVKRRDQKRYDDGLAPLSPG